MTAQVTTANTLLVSFSFKLGPCQVSLRVSFKPDPALVAVLSALAKLLDPSAVPLPSCPNSGKN